MGTDVSDESDEARPEARRSGEGRAGEELVEAVRHILSRLHRLHDLGVRSPQQTARVEREVLFFLYEGGASQKWRADRAHSAQARELRRAAEANRALLRWRGLVTYDHAIPLATLCEGLRAATASHEAMRGFLARHVCGVVILREEEARLREGGLRHRMPAGARPDDHLARYRAVGIAFGPEDECRLSPDRGAERA